MKSVLFLLFTFVIAQTQAATEDEAFQWYSSLHSLPAKKSVLKEIERERLFRNARFHKVAAVEHLPKYDPTGLIGFCFGRATAVHLLARKMGLEDASVKKLFVIGDLRSTPEPEWRFHVTTLVKGDDGKWWAVDPIMVPPIAPGGALPMEEWMKIVQSVWDKQKKAHFYLVANSTIIPDLREIPEPAKETGEKVNEISFDPTKKEGFEPLRLEGFKLFEVSKKAQHEFFTDAFEAKIEDRFEYLGVTINGQLFDYKNYYVDLLTDLKKETDGPRPFGEVELQSRHQNDPTSLYSPKVEAWFR